MTANKTPAERLGNFLQKLENEGRPIRIVFTDSYLRSQEKERNHVGTISEDQRSNRDW